MPERIAIVGASLAGGTAAATLRDQGFDGEIVLIGEEAQPPYERPPLSKEYLRGEEPFERALVRPEAFWADAGITLRTGERAESLDLEGGSVRLAGGDEVAFDRLLLTTGGVNRRLPVPGAALDHVLDLRTVADADRIREAASGASSAVVVGMGFIGAEVAASLRQGGLDVTVVEVFSTALVRALGEEVGRAVEAFHRDHGVVMRFDDGVEAFEGDGRVERVRTKTGDAVECDLAVVGVGIRPATELAEAAGLEVDDGIVVDELCRTSAEGVYAAGDVARHVHPLAGGPIRVEHWNHAIKQGEAAARSMLGAGEPYAEVHWFWSDQFEHNLQYAGFHGDHDQLVMRGSLEERRFAAFYLDGGKLIGVASLDWPRDVRRAQKLIAAGVLPDPAALRDPDVDLRTLLPAKEA
jgi:3-phenylpropionate/trans-cinnamate dioxygenase ferredoxin reductase component